MPSFWGRKWRNYNVWLVPDIHYTINRYLLYYT